MERLQSAATDVGSLHETARGGIRQANVTSNRLGRVSTKRVHGNNQDVVIILARKWRPADDNGRPVLPHGLVIERDHGVPNLATLNDRRLHVVIESSPGNCLLAIPAARCIRVELVI